MRDNTKGAFGVSRLKRWVRRVVDRRVTLIRGTGPPLLTSFLSNGTLPDSLISCMHYGARHLRHAHLLHDVGIEIAQLTFQRGG